MGYTDRRRAMMSAIKEVTDGDPERFYKTTAFVRSQLVQPASLVPRVVLQCNLNWRSLEQACCGMSVRNSGVQKSIRLR